MKKCTICGESWDEQFISRYETIGKGEKKVIHLCEYCCWETDYDEDEDMEFQEHEFKKYYPSYLL